jgi:pimeloyl-ACP methyl ester carboxylesterase
MKDYEDHWLTRPEGLRVYARDYAQEGAQSDRRPALLCLHGLTRNSADFEDLASTLCAHQRVIAVDQRGRGRSDYDPDPGNYNLLTYVADTFALLDDLQISEFGLIGTSMGGLMAMLMASQQPARIRSVVLNDVGPVVETAGIARIQNYVGKSDEITSWADAAALARANNGLAFPDLKDEDWLKFAARTFVEDEVGVPHLAYDAAISQPLVQDQTSAVPADLWPVFDAMLDIPTLVIRGATSDILSAQTVAAMATRHHNLVSVEVPGRGHAPMLDEPAALEAVQAFLAALRPAR